MNITTFTPDRFIDFHTAAGQAVAWRLNGGPEAEVDRYSQQIEMIRSKLERCNSILSPTAGIMGESDNRSRDGLETGIIRIDELERKIAATNALAAEIDTAADRAGLTHDDMRLLAIRYGQHKGGRGEWARVARDELHMERSAIYERVPELERRLAEMMWPEAA